MKYKISAIMAISLLSANTVAATYGGANLAFLDYSNSGPVGDLSLTAAVGRFGVELTDNVGLEARLGVGLAGDSFDAFSLYFMRPVEVEINLENLAGVYVRVGVPETNIFNPYLILGYTKVKLEASIDGLVSDQDSDKDLSFGIGADLKVTSNFTLNLEYMNYFDKDAVEISGFALGFVSRF